MRQVLLSLAVVLLMTVPAHAQRGWGSDMGEPDVDSVVLKQIADLLGLDESQRMLAETLHEGYATQVAELGAEMQEMIQAAREEFRDSRDVNVWRDVGRIGNEFREQKQKLTGAFFEDLRLTMGADDQSKWDEVGRLHRRTRVLTANASLSGEGIDLVSITEDLEIGNQEGVSTVLRDYQMDLDRAIVARESAQEEIRADPFAFFGPNAGDDARAKIEEGRDAAAAVREVHRRYARLIRPQLSPDDAAAFDAEVQSRSFPRVYRETRAEESISAAMGLDDLTPDQQEAIDGLRGRFERDLAAANQRLAEAIEEDELTRDPMSRWRGRRGDDSGLRELNEEKSELVDSTVAALRQILSADQLKELPKDEGSDWRNRAMRSLDGM